MVELEHGHRRLRAEARVHLSLGRRDAGEASGAFASMTAALLAALGLRDCLRVALDGVHASGGDRLVRKG